MLYSQIATLINTVIVPNLFGQGESGGSAITITEDLRNVVDVGTALADLSADDIKDYMKNFAVGVYKNYVDTRSYKDETYDMYYDSLEYGGMVQRIKAKLYSASDTHILTLESANDPVSGASAPDYTDGKFYGFNGDSLCFTKSVGFKIKYSISTTMFKKSFTDAEGVAKLVALIEAAVDNTLRLEMNGLARGMIRKMILNAKNGNRVIPLLTTYNTEMGYTSSDPGYVTLASWANDVTFKLWVQNVLLDLRDYITDYNVKYNDGTVPTFTPKDDARCIMLSAFAHKLDTALGSVYHKEMVQGTGAYKTVNFWQNETTELLPVIKSGSLFDQVKETETDGTGTKTTTIDHIVALLYDKEGAIMNNVLEKTTTKYVPEEDFTTFYMHKVKSLQVDNRDCTIILTLA